MTGDPERRNKIYWNSDTRFVIRITGYNSIVFRSLLSRPFVQAGESDYHVEHIVWIFTLAYLFLLSASPFVYVNRDPRTDHLLSEGSPGHQRVRSKSKTKAEGKLHSGVRRGRSSTNRMEHVR